MSPEEQALYTDVTTWLMREHLYAFQGKQRHLLLISFHRRMASSLAALAVSLDRVAQRLRDRLARRGHAVSDDGTQFLRDMAADLEEDERLGAAEDDDDADAPPVEAEKAVSETDEGIRAELEVVVVFAARAHGSKARRLIEALRFIQERGSQGLGSGKAVIFTESLTTQDSLRTLLLEHGYEPGDVRRGATPYISTRKHRIGQRNARCSERFSHFRRRHFPRLPSPSHTLNDALNRASPISST